mgnify:CR=1 FL=1
MTKTDLLLTKIDIEEAVNSFNKKCDIIGCPEEKISIGRRNCVNNAPVDKEATDEKNFVEIAIDTFNKRDASERRFSDAESLVETIVGKSTYLPMYTAFTSFTIKEGTLLVAMSSKGVYTFSFARS